MEDMNWPTYNYLRFDSYGVTSMQSRARRLTRFNVCFYESSRRPTVQRLYVEVGVWTIWAHFDCIWIFSRRRFRFGDSWRFTIERRLQYLRAVVSRVMVYERYSSGTLRSNQAMFSLFIIYVFSVDINWYISSVKCCTLWRNLWTMAKSVLFIARQ